MNVLRLYWFVQIKKMSSIYLERWSDCSVVVSRNFCIKPDMYTLAMVGENAAPIVIPVVCWNTVVIEDINVKQL